MHNLDRVLTQQETYNEASFGNHEYLGETTNEYANEYTGEYNAEYTGEFNEAEFAAELLSIGNEAELEQFFGKLFKTVAKGVSSIARSPVGKIIGGALKSAAKTALPALGAALGSAIPIPGVGTALGGMAGKALASALEMEAAGMSMEDREFEAAQGIVRLAANAARAAAAAPPGANPNAVASNAMKTAISAIGQGGTGAAIGAVGRRLQQGRWVRRGNTIVIIGA
jgi:hypothetical protein